MTEISEQPLRPLARGWPGLKSDTGKLLKEPGELSRCVNVEIDVPDTLSKRRGIVRGIEEWFEDPICGLFTYTDLCQQEHILIATQDAIYVRQPFALPVFQVADCYPFSDFGTESDGADPDADSWKHQGGDLEVRSASLGLKSTAVSVPVNEVERVINRGSITWFKDSCKSSYEVEVDVDLVDPSGGFEARAWILMRGAERGFASGAFLIGEIYRASDGTRMRILHVDVARAVTEVASSGPITDENGLFRLIYNASTYEATARFRPDVGSQVDITHTFSAVQDASFGLATGLAMLFTGTEDQPRPASFVAPAFGIDDVDSGAV